MSWAGACCESGWGQPGGEQMPLLAVMAKPQCDHWHCDWGRRKHFLQVGQALSAGDTQFEMLQCHTASV